MARKVLVSFKIMPKSVDSDLEKMKKNIEEKHKDLVENFKIEDIAFGIKMLRVLYLVGDESDITDKLQNELEKIDEIESVECDCVTLV
ncbi:MAG: elongation factor 1-beta [Candidatus Aenigmarchaeota archaeon]|nr:elongation factor 1-beta [Candidatus Aenigmarchaeota archaeon]